MVVTSPLKKRKEKETRSYPPFQLIKEDSIRHNIAQMASLSLVDIPCFLPTIIK